MKAFFLVACLLATAVGAHAQQSTQVAPGQPLPTQQQPAATDAWGTDVTPATPKDQTNVNTNTNVPAMSSDPATPASGDATGSPATAPAAPSGIATELGAGAPAKASGSTAVKPITTSPKLNPNSSGTYNKKIVKKQNKHTDKVITKRRRATTRYAENRRGEQIQGIRQMERGKVFTGSNRR